MLFCLISYVLFSSKECSTYRKELLWNCFPENGRSSDLSRHPACLPDHCQWLKEMFAEVLQRLTAAGLSGILTRFPFNGQRPTAFIGKVTNSISILQIHLPPHPTNRSRQTLATSPRLGKNRHAIPASLKRRG